MAKSQTFNGFVKFIGTEAAYTAMTQSAAGKLIFAEITDITPAQSVTDMTGTGDSKIHEFRIFANGIEYNLTNRAAFNAAVAKLREAASINVEAFVGTGKTKQAASLISAGTLQATLETLAQRVQDNYDAAIVTVDSDLTGDTKNLVYTINQGGEKIIDINIPRDQFLKKAEIVYGEYDPATGFTPVNNGEYYTGDTTDHSLSADAKTYIHFVFQVNDEVSGSVESHVYLDASSLIDVYTGMADQKDTADSAKTEDILVHVTEDNEIYAVIRPNGALETRINAAIEAIRQAQDLSSTNAGIKVIKTSDGTTVTLQVATTTVGSTEVGYLDIVEESGNEGVRIAEGAIQHDIVSGSASTKLVTEAAVWNTLAWDEVGSTANPATVD